MELCYVARLTLLLREALNMAIEKFVSVLRFA